VRGILILRIGLEGRTDFKKLILNELASGWAGGTADSDDLRFGAEVHTDMNVYVTYQVISSPGISTKEKMDWLVGSNVTGIRRPW
jgi:hypothetical protein